MRTTNEQAESRGDADETDDDDGELGDSAGA